VIGVLEPGARAAVAATKTRKVAVIGTEATIGSNAYEKAIRRLAPDVEVRSLACPLFVQLAEEGWTDNDVAELVAERYLSPLRGTGIDALVLGCTHYPLLKPVISRVIGPGITLIDSATETAKEVAQVLEKLKWRGAGKSEGIRKYYVTDTPARFEKIGKRFLGDSRLHAEQVRVGGV
jgi:glutamate racemase